MDRQMSLGVFAMMAGHHAAAWRKPEAYRGDRFSEYVELAKIAEAAKFDLFFVADSLSVRLGNPQTTGKGPLFAPTAIDPMALITALSAVTSRIGLVSTSSATYTEPYNLARFFAAADHISGGRVGWNIVTTADAESAKNYGLDNVPDHDERYVRAEEYVDLITALWDSWTDDAVLCDRESGQWIDMSKQRFRGHSGKYYKVGGPLNEARPPQGHPLLVQAGSSEPGRNLGARVADVIFAAGTVKQQATEFYADMKARARRFGRNPDSLIIMPGISPIVGSTEEDAMRRLADLNEGLSLESAVQGLKAFMPDIDIDSFPLDEPVPEIDQVTQAQQSRQKLAWDMARRENMTVREMVLWFAGTRGHNTVAGPPEMIADVMEDYFRSAACDGFNVMPMLLPDFFRDFVEQVVPILRKRGLFREEYAGNTLREHLGLARPQLF